jgi:hypothetical protein
MFTDARQAAQPVRKSWPRSDRPFHFHVKGDFGIEIPDLILELRLEKM